MWNDPDLVYGSEEGQRLGKMIGRDSMVRLQRNEALTVVGKLHYPGKETTVDSVTGAANLRISHLHVEEWNGSLYVALLIEKKDQRVPCQNHRLGLPRKGSEAPKHQHHQIPLAIRGAPLKKNGARLHFRRLGLRLRADDPELKNISFCSYLKKRTMDANGQRKP